MSFEIIEKGNKRFAVLRSDKRIINEVQATMIQTV
jgi:hypothetical protein